MYKIKLQPGVFLDPVAFPFSAGYHLPTGSHLCNLGALKSSAGHHGTLTHSTGYHLPTGSYLCNLGALKSSAGHHGTLTHSAGYHLGALGLLQPSAGYHLPTGSYLCNLGALKSSAGYYLYVIHIIRDHRNYKKAGALEALFFVPIYIHYIICEKSQLFCVLL